MLYYVSILLVITYSIEPLFQKTYVTDQLTQMFEVNASYLVQMLVMAFPLGSNQLPQLIVQSIPSHQVRENETDSIAYATRSESHSILVNGLENIHLFVHSINVQNVPNLIEDSTMQFTISIYIQNTLPVMDCQFPKYGTNCKYLIEQVDVGDISVIVNSGKWLYAYYVLDNQDYELQVNSDIQYFGLSLLPLDKRNITVLPSFDNMFQVVHPNQLLTVTLNRITDISNYIFAIGIYNFDDILPQTINISLNTIGTKDTQYWIYIVSGVAAIGIIIILIICYQTRKAGQIAPQIIQPALSRQTLDNYMPIKRVEDNLLEDSCAICLIQYEYSTLVRNTPCGHVFHDNCLAVWTIKQASCPVCRQSFIAEDVQKLMQSQKRDLDNSRIEAPSGPLELIPVEQQSPQQLAKCSPDVTDNSPFNNQYTEQIIRMNQIDDIVEE